ncbi:MAG: SPOR domain-containing protein [Xanthomonadales bacterium]|nr:SPOR domain-containing protein [Xanthomonadales bacterium]
MDKALKQRLVGASVLIILAVIVLPMLLSGRSDRLKHESNQIELPPKPEELSIKTRRFPVGIPNKPSSAAKQVADDAGEALSLESPPTDGPELASVNTETEIPVPQPETDMVEAQEPGTDVDGVTTSGLEPVEEQAPADTVVKSPEVTSITLSSGKPESLDLIQAVKGSEAASRYLVQVASFSNERNANVLADLLEAENLPVLMDVVDRPAGRMYRVRVGPYAKRSEADSLVSSLSAKMTDLTPRVLDLRPDESAPVSTPSDPLVRWVVQVGSFSQEKSAKDLVAKLRLAGLSAFSEKVSSSAGTTYKVRIGPELDRDKATELVRKVKSEHNLDAFVTTQE